MNRTVRNSGSSPASGGTLWARLYRGAPALLVALCLFILPAFANAACGHFAGPGARTAVKLPPADPGFQSPSDHPTVVGLWHVIYTSDGATFNDTFDTWHADGTEFEMAYLAPAAGDVCVGVWVPTGPRSVKLHHVGWIFDPSTPTATATNYFTLDEENTVDEDNKTYTGKFTFKVWTLDGKTVLQEAKGTIAATRITVH